jgi:hypothetical protein
MMNPTISVNPRKINKNPMSLIDKIDTDRGLAKIATSDKQISVRDNLVFVDTRDCVGRQSLIETQNFAEGRGSRNLSSGYIKNVTGTGISPIVVTIESTTSEKRLKDGDFVKINDVIGNTNANGNHKIINVSGSTFSLIGRMGNGEYGGSGIWKRDPDSGYPTLNESTNTIIGNEMRIHFLRRLRVIRSLSLIHAVIPRDIIPITTYFPGFVGTSILPLNSVTDCTTVENVYTTYIPQEKAFLESQLIGFYSTPIEVFRTYINANFSLPCQITPGPLKLWNPPVGPWPLQPVPYPYQTVPTYKSNDFSVIDEMGLYNIILSGYGVYDLLDWSISVPISIPVPPFTMDIGAIFTDMARKFLLLMITPKQSFRNKDYIDLIFNSTTVDIGSTTFPFGYGDYQRFIPGPGIQQNYQPGTSDNTDPTIVGPDWDVPFPNFRGNVFGPYNSPGDKFQKMGVLQTVQDLYLNGDTNNLFGNPIIKQDTPTECLMQDSTFGLNFSSINPINLRNFEDSCNPNVKNAMRLVPNGFGALSVRATGDGNPNYVNQFNPGGLGGAGGIGPDVNGVPPGGSAWVDNPIGSSSGDETFGNPIATGPIAAVSTTTIVVGPAAEDVDATLSGAEVAPVNPRITNRTSWFDLGANNGAFTKKLADWKTFTISELPDTNIVINMLEAQRTIRSQGTNSNAYSSILSFPVRLNLGTSTGTFQYSENLQVLLASSSSSNYWTKRYLNPLSQLDELHLTFTTYEGDEIPLEVMLQERDSVYYLRTFERIFGYDKSFLDFNLGNRELSFMFNPLNPQLIGRMKRNLSMIFKIETYEYVNPGLEIDMVRNMLERSSAHEDFGDSDDEDGNNFVVRAANYGDYS